MDEVFPYISEAAKEARFGYRLLVLASAALIAFSLAPQPVDKIQLALDEIDALQELLEDGLFEELFFADRANRTIFLDNLDHTHSIILSENTEIDINLLQGALAMVREGYQPIHPFPPPNSTIQEIYEAINFRDISHSSHLVFDSYTRLNEVPPNFDQVSIEIGPLSGCGDTRANLAFSRRLANGGIVGEIVGCASVREIQDEYVISLRDLAMASSGSETLFQEENGSASFIPSIRSVWDQVESSTLQEARRDLAFVSRPVTPTLELFGLTFHQNLISWGAPLLLISISSFFCAHTLNVAQIVNKNREILLFPWTPLLPGTVPGVIVFVSVVALPICALICVGLLTWSQSVTYIKVAYSTFSAFVSFVLLITVRTIFQLRQRRSAYVSTGD